MPINQTQLDHYREKGWVVVEGVYPPAVVDEVAALAMRIGDAQIESGETGDFDVGEDGADVLPRKVDQPFSQEPRFRPFVLDTGLADIIEKIVGEPPLLFGDQVFMKPPRVGSEKPFHQDNFYFRLEPADHVITAWIALDDVDEENGCLRYIDGSHLGPLLPHEPQPDKPTHLIPPTELIDLSRESLAPVRKGGVVFHHGKTLHTSAPNRSDRWRRAYATHWVTASVKDTQGPTGRLAGAYFKQPEFAELFSS